MLHIKFQNKHCKLLLLIFDQTQLISRHNYIITKQNILMGLHKSDFQDFYELDSQFLFFICVTI